MNEQQAREIVRERSGSVCELCGRARATDYSHRQARSQLGDWSPENALHLCREDHANAHRFPDWAREYGVFVASHDNPADVPVRCRHGWVLLDAEGNMVRYDPPVTLPPDIAESLNYLAF